MNKAAVKSDILLLITAVIWGFGFVAQRVGMDHLGPFAFNGARFALGTMFLVPFIIWQDRKRNKDNTNKIKGQNLIMGGCLAGVVLFAGASFQQIGIVYTTAGNAGFITGLYVILVPLLGLFVGRKTNKGTWFGAVLAVSGLYLLSVKGDFVASYGDSMVLIGAFIWALHVLVIDRLSKENHALKLAFIQFLICSVLSFITAFSFETIELKGFLNAAVPLAYGGLISVGIAYTLQVVAQKEAHPAHASIFLSLEGFFAAVGGWMILDEMLSPREITGCILMFSGMLLSQIWIYFKTNKA
jgi:drug/metabolite transporter (DMT)-like permease